MVGSSKILTVSYGTFSCTLEGFDDPFVTMKSIAEYFRDLAADDRFFGAEPPQPDVQYLHALAQQNTLSRVDAEVEENGLRLRQEPPQDGKPVVSTAAPEPQTTAPSQPMAVPTMTRTAPSAAVAPAAETPTATAFDDVSEDATDDDTKDDAPVNLTAHSDEPWAHPDDDEGENLFDVSGDDQAAVSDKLATARAKVDAVTDPKPVAADTTMIDRAENRRRGLALSLTDDDLADATARPARPRQRPDAFTLRADEDADATVSTLSDEAEAELMAELAALEAEDSDLDTPVAPPNAALRNTPAKAGRAILESDLIEREDAAIDRLLAKTNSKLNDDSVQLKRNQLSHLKAAVAATMADRAADPSGTQHDDSDTAYRDDLAKVVRPRADDANDGMTPAERHAAAKATRQAEPTAPAPDARPKNAPLVLVSNGAPAQTAQPSRPQRATGEAVAPRRINRNDPNRVAEASENKAKFADYAQKVGANELSDLLEAAGAFLNTVEGKPVFTRPQIMQMVLRQDEGKRFTREDSLRGFDNLVRKGAIQRVDRGQFAIASESRFVS